MAQDAGPAERCGELLPSVQGQPSIKVVFQVEDKVPMTSGEKNPIS